jgi:hypothetical protein
MFDVIEKKRDIQVADYDITAGDLADAVGKIYMKDLWESIERNRKLEEKRIFFLTMIRKNPTKLTEIIVYILPFEDFSHKMRESTDLWEYDYEKEKLQLIWSVPHRTEMKNFLRSPEKYSKDLIKWIRQYLHQENINLQDSSAQVIK